MWLATEHAVEQCSERLCEEESVLVVCTGMRKRATAGGCGAGGGGNDGGVCRVTFANTAHIIGAIWQRKTCFRISCSLGQNRGVSALDFDSQKDICTE